MKSRIYVEHFPAERPSSPYMAAYYDSLLKSLRADQVHAVDRYREARYQIDNREWLMRASASAQNRCTPSDVKVSLAAGGFASDSRDQVQAGVTADTAYLDLSFDKPSSNLDYLLASMATGGSRSVQPDASWVNGVRGKWVNGGKWGQSQIKFKNVNFLFKLR